MTQYAIPVIVLVHSSTYATHKPRGQTPIPKESISAEECWIHESGPFFG